MTSAGLKAIRAMRPNHTAWEGALQNPYEHARALGTSYFFGFRECQEVAEYAHAIIAKVVDDPALYALAGKDLISRLIMAELVLDQVITMTQSPKASTLRCTTLMSKMFAAFAAAAEENSSKYRPATSQHELDTSANQLRTEGRHITKAVWQL